MKLYVKIVNITLILVLTFGLTAIAENKVENNSSVEMKVETEVDIEQSEEVNEIADKLETLLDPENNELEEKAAETLEKHADNWFVKVFKSIIDAIGHFLNAVLEMASEAAKIGVD